MLRKSWLFPLLLIACSSSPEHAEPGDSATGGDAAPVCEVGADQSCNDDPAISSLHGTCQRDGTCQCLPGIEKNPATGRCN